MDHVLIVLNPTPAPPYTIGMWRKGIYEHQDRHSDQKVIKRL
jgi:hypothetical protein